MLKFGNNVLFLIWWYANIGLDCISLLIKEAFQLYEIAGALIVNLSQNITVML